MYHGILLLILLILFVVIVVLLLKSTDGIISGDETSPEQLKIVQYNIKARPYIDDIPYRLLRVGKYNKIPNILNLINADVIVLNEAFSDVIVNNIKKRLAYPYSTNLLNYKTNKITNGGVIIFSKYPIITTTNYCFKNSENVDSWAAKGVQYAKIDKSGQIYNIFATHTNASYNGKKCIARVNQISEIRDFIKSMNISIGEPLILAGDMNIEYGNDEYLSMLNTISVVNAGNTTPTTTDEKLIDYILYSKYHKQPTTVVSTVEKVHNKISDHYPVVGLFSF